MDEAWVTFKENNKAFVQVIPLLAAIALVFVIVSIVNSPTESRFEVLWVMLSVVGIVVCVCVFISAVTGGKTIEGKRRSYGCRGGKKKR